MTKKKFISRSKNIYNEYPPSNKLKKYTDKVFEFTCSPHKNQSVKFHLIPSYFSSVLFISYSKSKAYRLVISGPNTKSNPIMANQAVHVVGIRFKPLLLPIILKITPSALLNKFVELSKAAGKEETASLLNRITKNNHTENIVRHLTGFILEKIPQSFNIEPDITAAVESIITLEGNIKLKDIYDNIIMSRRSFQRKFLEYSGLTPKEFCKIVRFENVLRKLVVNNYRHFDVLWESGYYDQSHYNKEFKEFSGLPPSAYEVRQRTISIRNVLK